MNAIPTRYAGYRFRSRLEARWASFFDQADWRWEYEPFDLNGWIPDFALIPASAEKPVLVEVKPIMAFDSDVAAELDRADQEHEILLLGMSPLLPSKYDQPFCFGWLRELNHGELHDGWDEACLRTWDHVFGFCHFGGSYHCRMTGAYDGSNLTDEKDCYERAQSYWAAAANQTQWRPR